MIAHILPGLKTPETFFRISFSFVGFALKGFRDFGASLSFTTTVYDRDSKRSSMFPSGAATEPLRAVIGFSGVPFKAAAGAEPFTAAAGRERGAVFIGEKSTCSGTDVISTEATPLAC
jgi:hypothetical protein